MPTEQKTYELVVEPRKIIGKQSKQIRREGKLPAVVYGHLVDPVAVQIDKKEIERVYLHAGNNSLVNLKMGDGNEARKVFIHQVQRNPITHELAHIDFMVVNLTEDITTMVQIVLVGESPIVAQNEGILLHLLDHVQIRTLPTNIPPMFQVDISGLDEIDKAIHVSDLEVPENVQVLTHPEEMIVKVAELRRPVEEPEEAEEAAEGEAEGAEETSEEAES